MNVDLIRYEPGRTRRPKSAMAVPMNHDASPKPDSVCKAISGRIGVWVPACIAGVTSQVSEEAQSDLIGSYADLIRKAATLGFDSVEIPSLGTGFKVVVNGSKKSMPGLYWSHVNSAGAAKKALEIVAGEVPDDFSVIFVIQDDGYNDWDDVMKF